MLKIPLLVGQMEVEFCYSIEHVLSMTKEHNLV
jgi:hypothetical protein